MINPSCSREFNHSNFKYLGDKQVCISPIERSKDETRVEQLKTMSLSRNISSHFLHIYMQQRRDFGKSF